MIRSNIRKNFVCLLATIGASCVALSGCGLLIGIDDHRLFPEDAATGDAAPAESGAATLFVQEWSAASSTSRTSLTLRPSKDVGSGSTLILLIGTSSANPLHPSSVVGGGVSWTLQSKGSMHVMTSLWTGFGAAPNGGDITISWTAEQNDIVVHGSEWRGLSGARAAPKTDGDEGRIAAPSIDVEQVPALVFAAAATHNHALGAPTNGFTPLTNVTVKDLQIIEAYRWTDAPGAVTTSWELLIADGWDAHIVALTP